MSAPGKLKLLLADDHALVREGIRSSLVRYPFISIVGEAANGKEAVRKCRDLHPDIVLMDLNMPEMSGLEATPLIRKTCPETKIIVLTVHDTKEYVFRLLRSGAHGYVMKDTSPRSWSAPLNLSPAAIRSAPAFPASSMNSCKPPKARPKQPTKPSAPARRKSCK